MINHHSTGLTTTKHATRHALCVARRTRPDARSVLLGRGALAAGAAWGLRALSLREEEEEGGAWRRLGAAGGG
jgi:hypothetical protein